MNKSNRIVAIVLVLAMVLWLFLTVFPYSSPSGKTDSTSSPSSSKVYEPKFTHEGDLYFLDAEAGDTIKEIKIEIAEQSEEIQYGMMYRKNVDPNTGMLFLMGEERQQSFWMKNTYISLDIIYLDSKGKVVSIQKNAQPLSEKSLPSEGPASMVLEVVGGFTDEHNISSGSQILYSRIQ